MSTTLYTGFVAKSLGGSDISPFVGFPVAAVLYAILCRGLDLPAERRVAAQQMAEIDPQGAVGLAEASGAG
jgi:NCS1 family nucleobase:cation symporter-1